MDTIVTADLAALLEQSETDAVFARLSSVQSVDGNPFDVHIERFGGATAFICKGIPSAYFNAVRGFGPDDLRHLPEILAFYRKQNMSGRFHIQPGQSSRDLFRRLADEGFGHTEFRTTLFAPVREVQVSPPHGLVIRALSADEFDWFGRIYVRAFGMPDSLASAVGENNRVLYGLPGWQFYLALMEGEPAAVAVSHTQNGITSLAAAATLPQYQRRGIQTALLHARLSDAVAAGSSYVVGQTTFASGSQNNMEKAGLRIAYTKSVWEPLVTR